MPYTKHFKILCKFPYCRKYDCNEHKHTGRKIMLYKTNKCKDCGTPIYQKSVRCNKDNLIYQAESKGLKRNLSKEVNKLIKSINYRITEKVQNKSLM